MLADSKRNHDPTEMILFKIKLRRVHMIALHNLLKILSLSREK